MLEWLTIDLLLKIILTPFAALALLILIGIVILAGGAFFIMIAETIKNIVKIIRGK